MILRCTDGDDRAMLAFAVRAAGETSPASRAKRLLGETELYVLLVERGGTCWAALLRMVSRHDRAHRRHLLAWGVVLFWSLAMEMGDTIRS